MSDIVYRDALASDAAALASFEARTFVATFGHLYPSEDLKSYLASKYDAAIQTEEIADPGVRYRLALRDGEIVGYCMMGDVDLAVDENNVLELYRLYVDESVKGAGVARALMEDCFAWARGKRATALYLGVWESNHRAQAFYKRYGFEHVGEHSFMVGKSADRDFIWRAAL